MTATLELPKIENKVISIKDIQVIKGDKETRVNLPVTVDGEQIETQPRFWTSMFSRYGFNQQFFKYYSHDEVFNRIHEVEKNDKIRICIERAADSKPKMLAVSNPSKPIADIDMIRELLTRYDGERLAYSNGELSALHAPRIGGSQLIGGDLFHNRFSVHVPIDGYGLTNLYLAMLRQVCSNGAVAISRAFRSTLQLGKSDDSVLPTLTRALDSYNNDEGFHALRSRIESSTTSWASVFEASKLYGQLIKMHLADEISADMASVNGNEFSSPVLSRFHKLTGDTSLLYGIANADALSEKRQRSLPVKCTMYDLVNFATEVSTHHSNPAGQRRLQGWFGSQISNEFDLEQTCQDFPNFADFHMDRRFSTGMTGSSVKDNSHLS